MKKFLQNIVKLKKISTIKDFRFGTFPSISGSGYTFYRPPQYTVLVPGILCVVFRLVNQNKQKPGHKCENVRLLISFEKAFINQFLRIILSPRYGEFSPIKLGGKLFHIGADIRPKKHSRKMTASILTPFSELLSNLYYSPIKKLENIFIFKIARQQHS